jgi:hypothetical protein
MANFSSDNPPRPTDSVRCDFGVASPRGKYSFPVERDRHFSANKTLSAYADEARSLGRITT